MTLAIFSSGSVEAQKMFSKYVGNASGTEDLNPLFAANFDTINAGPKMVKESYEKIAKEMGKTVGEVLFLSDNINGKILTPPFFPTALFRFANRLFRDQSSE
jgi:enolase-phosphatase E1